MKRTRARKQQHTPSIRCVPSYRIRASAAGTRPKQRPASCVGASQSGGAISFHFVNIAARKGLGYLHSPHKSMRNFLDAYSHSILVSRMISMPRCICPLGEPASSTSSQLISGKGIKLPRLLRRQKIYAEASCVFSGWLKWHLQYKAIHEPLNSWNDVSGLSGSPSRVTARSKPITGCSLPLAILSLPTLR